MNPHYSIVAERAEHLCEYCRAPEAVCNFPFEVDHFIPLSQNGSNETENLVLACRSCNAFKAFHEIGLSEESTAARLFNPRRDTWTEHFHFNPETFEIEGLTAIGWGTINRLKVNSPSQRQARMIWFRAGIYS
ncbi:MAG: HNH endonuclease [Acidobacteria bacterium]|nr:HNH endonuclease [Acidobacteriota bacterium]